MKPLRGGSFFATRYLALNTITMKVCSIDVYEKAIDAFIERGREINDSTATINHRYSEIATIYFPISYTSSANPGVSDQF
jgi:hypothetical protein